MSNFRYILYVGLRDHNQCCFLNILCSLLVLLRQTLQPPQNRSSTHSAQRTDRLVFMLPHQCKSVLFKFVLSIINLLVELEVSRKYIPQGILKHTSLIPRPLPDISSQPWRKIGRRPGSLLHHGPKWWTQLVCNVDLVCTNRVHHFRPMTYNDPRPSPDFSPQLRDKIWEWPGDKARNTQLAVTVSVLVVFQIYCKWN